MRATASAWARRGRGWIAGRVVALLEPRASHALAEEAGQLRAATDQLDDRLLAARARLDPGPFRGEMTVHAAHARHPRVQAIFAARGLPHCPSCAVGADETITEAAMGEGLDLQELLATLRALES